MYRLILTIVCCFCVQIDSYECVLFMCIDGFLRVCAVYVYRTILTSVCCFSLQVHGIIRRSSTFNTSRIEHLYADPKSHTEGCTYSFIMLYLGKGEIKGLMPVLSIEKEGGKPPVSLCHHSLIASDVMYYLTFKYFVLGGGGCLNENYIIEFLVRH